MSNMSQEEIDRLLNAAMEVGGAEQQQDAISGIPPETGTVQLDELGEIGTRLAETAGDTLQATLKQPVTVAIAKAAVQTSPDVLLEYQSPMLLMEGTYVRGLSGNVLMLMKEQDAGLLSDILTSDDVAAGGAAGRPLSGLNSVMHRMFGTQDFVLTEMMKTQVQAVMGDMTPVSPESGGMLRWAGETELFAALHFDAVIDSAIQVALIQMIPQKTIDLLTDAMNRADGALSATNQADGAASAKTGDAAGKDPGADTAVSAADKPRQAPKNGQGMGEIRNMKAREQQTLKRDQKGVQQMRYQSFDKKKKPPVSRSVHDNIGMIIDMPLQVTVELGRVRMSIKEILAFHLGSIIELNRMADDLADVKVNGKLIARGEIVVVDENYGVRITDIESRERRMKRN